MLRETISDNAVQLLRNTQKWLFREHLNIKKLDDPRFDMGAWVYEDECGTACCIAGHVIIQETGTENLHVIMHSMLAAEILLEGTFEKYARASIFSDQFARLVLDECWYKLDPTDDAFIKARPYYNVDYFGSKADAAIYAIELFIEQCT